MAPWWLPVWLSFANHQSRCPQTNAKRTHTHTHTTSFAVPHASGQLLHQPKPRLQSAKAENQMKDRESICSLGISYNGDQHQRFPVGFPLKPFDKGSTNLRNTHIYSIIVSLNCTALAKHVSGVSLSIDENLGLCAMFSFVRPCASVGV